MVAFITPEGQTRLTLGRMQRSAVSPDTWEMLWKIPDDLVEGAGTLRVRLEQGGAVLASDSETVVLDHQDPPASPTNASDPRVKKSLAAETAAITWPQQGGPLGFYKGANGLWTTTIDGMLTAGTDAPGLIQYSITPVGKPPVFKQCATDSGTLKDGFKLFHSACTLAAGELPSWVTAIAVVPQRNQGFPQSAAAAMSPDIHRVKPYLQAANGLNLAVKTIPGTQNATYPSGARREAGAGCMTVKTTVTDNTGRPVVGANLDVHLSGPEDSAAFGTGAFQVPAGMVEQDASNCSGGATGKQGVVRNDGGADVKVVESTGGTDKDGAWSFNVFSPKAEPGVANVLVWVDALSQTMEDNAAATDDDAKADTEASAATIVQWLTGAARVSIETDSKAATVDTCKVYTVVVWSGLDPIPDANVDIHARGPGEKIQFCDVRSGQKLRAPDSGGHGTVESPGGDEHPAETTQCAGKGPICVHREGETDKDGRLMVGIISHGKGETSFTAWFDGEGGNDNDLNDVDVLSTTLPIKWVGNVVDTASVTFSNPSDFPKTTLDDRVTRDEFLISVSVDAPMVVDKVSFELGNTNKTKWVPLGEVTPVQMTENFEYLWDLNDTNIPAPPPPAPPPAPLPVPTPTPSAPPATGSIPDGSYVLKATIIGKGSDGEVKKGASVEKPIVVDRAANAAPSDPPPEWVKITSPVNGHGASFDGRAVRIEGTASKDAEGVEYFFTTTKSGVAPVWNSTSCGYTDLKVSTAPQNFAGICWLPATERPLDVTGVAAVVFDCTQSDCDANPAATPVPRQGASEGGDAVRIRPCSGTPCLVVSPGEWIANAGTCQPFVAEVVSFTGDPVDANVDVHLDGPDPFPRFCEPEGGGVLLTDASFGHEQVAEHSSVHLGDPSGFTHHGQGSVNQGGIMRFGVSSARSSFESIYSPSEDGHSFMRLWIDANRDDMLGANEATATAVTHWSLEGHCTIIGTEGADVIHATEYPDKICGLGGDDLIYGLDGATGHDIVLGGAGDDIIQGRRGDDVLQGGPGSDQIYGGDGNDVAQGGTGDDQIYGEAGDDSLDGGNGEDGCLGAMKKKGKKKKGKKEKDVIDKCELEASLDDATAPGARRPV